MRAKLLVLVLFVLALVAIAIPAISQEQVTIHSAELLLSGAPAQAETASAAEAESVVGLTFPVGRLEGVELSDEGLTLAADATTGLYESPVIEAPLPFNAVVPQWVADLPLAASLTIRMRTGTAAGWWSEWYLIERNDDWTLPTDKDNVGPMIAVPAVDETHERVQVSVRFSRYADSPSAVLRDLRLTFIDATDGPSSEELLARQEAQAALQPESAGGGYPKPTVVSRNIWCTDPDCNYSDGLSYHPVSHLILHHTVSSNSSSDWAAVVRAIWRFHTYTREWGDIGYNYLVDRNGVLYEGHNGGDDVIGTHAAGANRGSMALALMGDFVSERPPATMLSAAAELFAWKADQKGIDVYDAGYLPNVDWGLPHLMGHRDVYGTTQCPGDQAHLLLPWLRNEVAGRIGFTSPYIYVDELSSAFSRSNNGSWYTASGGCGFNGHAYYTFSVTDPGASTNWGEWRISVPESGAYEVQVYAPYCVTGRAETDGARYTITHAFGTATAVVSHNDHVGTWMTLGSYNFNAGGNGKVRLTDLTNTDTGLGVWFDAIRLVPGGSLPPMEAVNLQPAVWSWLNTRTVTFQWETHHVLADATIDLQVAQDPSFETLLLVKELPADTTSYSHTFDRDYSQLHWRVVIRRGGDSVASAGTQFGIDTTPPTARVARVLLLEDGRYVLGQEGSDGGSGIRAYSVYYRPTGSSTWTTLFTETAFQSVSFVPPNPAATYEFASRAVDRVGNWEALPGPAEASTSQRILVSRRGYLPLIGHQ
ncbi:MAG: N-acetylmuramoyl-L-alanine amidase [Candidatus Promineifilaceae bacterium]|nr:N-acetylmuramoyl-L-alanine amidase [Candidatus Promineifilaceae bacterium]